MTRCCQAIVQRKRRVAWLVSRLEWGLGLESGVNDQDGKHDLGGTKGPSHPHAATLRSRLESV